MKAQSSKKKTHKKRGAKSKDPVYVMASVSQLSYIDSLIETSLTNNRQYQELKQKADKGLTEGEAEEFITDLLEIQRNPILGGYNYQQGDITKMLKLL